MLLVAAAGMTSCVPLQQYHTEPPGEQGCVPDPESGAGCERAFIEERPEYLLGFVEFDDLGWAWQRSQQEALLDRLEKETEDGDVLMVVFAHGWKHNADSCDTNVTCFRDILLQLHRTETLLAAGGRARRIVGIYIGWRGDSSRGKLLRQTTFYGRKGTAHKVGSGAVTELLVRLNRIRDARHRRVDGSSTRLVLVGHSFGGALMFSASSQLIMERLAVAAASEDNRVRGFGDLVVLVNPAFEAARFQPLHEAATNGSYPDDQNPVLVIVTSQSDTATSKAFPAGRFFSAKRDDYRDDAKGAEQKQANRKAVGHFPPYRTHFLEPHEGTPQPEKADKGRAAACGCPFDLDVDRRQTMTREQTNERVNRLRMHRWEGEGGTPELRFPLSTLRWDTDKPPSNSPIFVISTDPQIISRHSDIYQLAFVDFLRYLILSAGERVTYQ